MGACDEVRLDADPATEPDVVASIVDLGDIGPFDAIYCSHTLEHVYPHEVGRVLREFRRVLSPGGHALIFVPDLEGLVLSEEVLYDCPAGGITSHDMFYGWRPALEKSPYMAHHTGFTSATLEAAVREAGFSRAMTKRLYAYNLLVVAER